MKKKDNISFKFLSGILVAIFVFWLVAPGNALAKPNRMTCRCVTSHDSNGTEHGYIVSCNTNYYSDCSDCCAGISSPGPGKPSSPSTLSVPSSSLIRVPITSPTSSVKDSLTLFVSALNSYPKPTDSFSLTSGSTGPLVEPLVTLLSSFGLLNVSTMPTSVTAPIVAGINDFDKFFGLTPASSFGMSESSIFSKFTSALNTAAITLPAGTTGVSLIGIDGIPKIFNPASGIFEAAPSGAVVSSTNPSSPKPSSGGPFGLHVICADSSLWINDNFSGAQQYAIWYSSNHTGCSYAP